MAKHRAEWWQKRIDEWAAGGDPEAIARRHGVRLKTLSWWRSELPRRARRTSIDAAPTFVPLVVGVPSTSATTTSDAGSCSDVVVVVQVGAARMSVRGPIGTAHVEAIVRGLVAHC